MGEIVTLDQALLDLGKQLPGGFGGLYRGSDGRVVVWLKDEAKAEQALTQLLLLHDLTPRVLPRIKLVLQQDAAPATWAA
jgi:hypothetical protein